MPTRRLLTRARRSRHGFLIPAPADDLRIWLAQALFQNLALDLSGLLAVRDLLRPAVITAARAEASREGWRPITTPRWRLRVAPSTAWTAGLPLNLPVPLPVPLSLRAESLEHRITGTRWECQALLTKTRRYGYLRRHPEGKGW